jgi:hypothetical protein
MKKKNGLSGDQRSFYFIVSGSTDKPSKNLHCGFGEKIFGQNFPSKFCGFLLKIVWSLLFKKSGTQVALVSYLREEN